MPRIKLPRIEPLTLTRIPQPFDDADWVFEIKPDGFRGVAYVADKACRLMSRNANVFKKFSSLSAALTKLPVQDAIIDGEVVCIDGNGVSRFNELMFRPGMPYFYGFDLMWLNGKDLRPRPLIERKQQLRELVLKANNPALLYADHIDEYGCDFYRMICDKDLEGIVAKHRDSRYHSSAKWKTIKNPAYTQSRNRNDLFESSSQSSRR
jgi:bifunctional non-homologous end joining protein LigD